MTQSVDKVCNKTVWFIVFVHNRCFYWYNVSDEKTMVLEPILLLRHTHVAQATKKKTYIMRFSLNCLNRFRCVLYCQNPCIIPMVIEPFVFIHFMLQAWFHNIFRRVHITKATLLQLGGRFEVEPGDGVSREGYLADHKVESYLIIPPKVTF